MKKTGLVFLLNLIFLGMQAQEIVVPGDSVSGYPKYYELGDEKYRAWQKIEEQWKKEYAKILKEQKLKMSCSGCESIYIDVVLSVTAQGKMEYYKAVNSNKCSEKFSKGLEIRFMKWFFNYEFPEELFNTKFEVRLGTGLKC